MIPLILLQAALASDAPKYDFSDLPKPGQAVTANQDFMKLYDLTKVPKFDVLTPHGNMGNVACTSKNTCHWSCGGCVNNDVLACPKSKDWGLAYDDGIKN